MQFVPEKASLATSHHPIIFKELIDVLINSFLTGDGF